MPQECSNVLFREATDIYTQTVASIIVAFTFSWQVTLVTSSVVLFIGLAVGILVPFIIKGTSRSTEAETKAGAVATEAFSGIRMVYACGAQKRMGDKYSSWVVEAKKHGMYTSPFVGLNFALVFFGLYSAFALCKCITVARPTHIPK